MPAFDIGAKIFGIKAVQVNIGLIGLAQVKVPIGTAGIHPAKEQRVVEHTIDFITAALRAGKVLYGFYFGDKVRIPDQG